LTLKTDDDGEKESFPAERETSDTSRRMRREEALSGVTGERAPSFQ
jgi:hypothetical protein